VLCQTSAFHAVYKCYFIWVCAVFTLWRYPLPLHSGCISTRLNGVTFSKAVTHFVSDLRNSGFAAYFCFLLSINPPTELSPKTPVFSPRLWVLRGAWIRIQVFWEMTPCRFMNVYRCFGANSSLLLRDLAALSVKLQVPRFHKNMACYTITKLKILLYTFDIPLCSLLFSFLSSFHYIFSIAFSFVFFSNDSI
jgi:hypothetical protein